MKLKLYSEEEIDPDKAEVLLKLLNLDTNKIDLILKEMTATVRSEESRETELAELSRKLNVDPEELPRYLGLFREIVLRVLLGRGNSDVQQDLVKHGFGEEQVKFLFSSVNDFPQLEKDAIKYWAMEGETHDDRDHIHAISTQPDVKTIIENGNLVGVFPISKIALSLYLKNKEDDPHQVCRLELGLGELSSLIAGLERTRQELDKTTAELKKKLGESVVSPPSG
jgi:hypothetical protein